MGFADETDISQFSRHTQGVRRLPEGTTRAELVLTGLIANDGRVDPDDHLLVAGSVAVELTAVPTTSLSAELFSARTMAVE